MSARTRRAHASAPDDPSPADRDPDPHSEREPAGKGSGLGGDVRRRCPPSRSRHRLSSSTATRPYRRHSQPRTSGSLLQTRRPGLSARARRRNVDPRNEETTTIRVHRLASPAPRRLTSSGQTAAASPDVRHAKISGRVGRVSASRAQRFALRPRPVETPLRYSSTACFSRRRNAWKSGLRSSMKAFSPSTASADPRAWASSSMPCCQEA